MRETAGVMKILSIILAVIVTALSSSAQSASEGMILHGSALHKAAGMFKVLNGFLYLESPEDASNILADVPKKLEFEYLRDIKAKLLVENSQETLTENLPPQQLAKIQKRVDEVNALFCDVKKGDRYSLYYRPGQGTELGYNGKVVGNIPGADFAAGYFSIWFGPEPLSKSFKKKVLTGERL